MQTTTCYCESVAQYTIHCWVIYLNQICGQAAAVCDINQSDE